MEDVHRPNGRRSSRSRSQNSERRQITDDNNGLVAIMNQPDDRLVQQKVGQYEQSPRISWASAHTKSSRDSMQMPKALVEELQEKFQNQDAQLAQIVKRQEDTERTANELVQSLKVAIIQINESQNRHDAIMNLHDESIEEIQKQNQIITEQNRQVEKVTTAHSQLIEAQLKDRQYMVDEIQRVFVEQSQRQGSQESETAQIKERLIMMKEENKRRTVNVGKLPEGQTNHQKIPPIQEQRQVKEESQPSESSLTSPEKENVKNSKSADSKTVIDGSTTTKSEPVIASTPQIQSFYPGMSVPNAMIDNCPAFTPQSYQQWRREIKLWLGAQAGASITQLLSKIIMVLPLAVKMDAMTYMEETENHPHSREMQKVFDILDIRYGKTDTEKSWMWLNQFTEFKRNVNAGESYRDFWSRYNRTVTKLRSLGINMNEEMIFHKAIQALRFPEGQLPIVLSALKTTGESKSIQALKEITINMYETHRPITDSSDVYHASPIEGMADESIVEPADEEWEYTDEYGQIFLMKPKKKSKGKNAPGAAEAARRGAVANFRGLPNRSVHYNKGENQGKGKTTQPNQGPCLRCGDPNHHYRDCPHPWREVLDFPQKGKGKSTEKVNQIVYI